jgi:NADP-dependent 3-hydroxy acid dehydrogenase YdfG
VIDRVVVITGASAGIGAATARRLATTGSTLALGARRSRELEEVARDARAAGAADVLTVVGDVTQRADVEALREATLERFGHIDVWINNAGRGLTRLVLDLTDDDLDAMVAVNVKSALYGMQAVVPHFQQRGTGHLINVSSALARLPVAPFRSGYSAAKAMLNSLTANLRMDLAQSHPGIHVTTVMPSVVLTEFSRNVIGEARAPRVPVGATAQTAEDVADAIAAVIEQPVAEIFTNPASPGATRDYYDALERDAQPVFDLLH